MKSVVHLDDQDKALLKGEAGPAMAFAMQLVVQAANIMGATSLVPISFAHIDACFYNGEAHLDFAKFCLSEGARFAVPAWSNNGVVSLTHLDYFSKSNDPVTVDGARRLMQLYEQLGCKPTWTCAPYHLPGGPKFGDHIVVGESNAVTYYNSVRGARTNKYGDYLDVACALVGKAPNAGLHRDGARRATLCLDVSDVPEALKEHDIFYHLLGHHVGKRAGRKIPVVNGLPFSAKDDDLRAVSSAVAASGGVELWHGVGLTPEANQLGDVFDGTQNEKITTEHLRQAQAELTTGRDGPIDIVAFGTPHFSPSEFVTLHRLLEGRKIKSDTRMIVTSSRFVIGLMRERGILQDLEAQGVEVIGDICSYYAPGLDMMKGRVMTNAGKWAYYAPGLLPVEVCFGSFKECVETALRGEVWRDPALAGLW